MQSAIHRAAETPSQIRMREEAKLRRARMGMMPAAAKVVPVISAENTAPKKQLEENAYAAWCRRQIEINQPPTAEQTALRHEAAAAAVMASLHIGETASVRNILNACSVYYDVPIILILSARRAKEIVRPRMVAIYLAKEMTTLSFPAIGRRFCNRDHTTILHSVRKIERLLKTDEQLAVDIAAIKAVLA